MAQDDGYPPHDDTPPGDDFRVLDPAEPTLAAAPSPVPALAPPPLEPSSVASRGADAEAADDDFRVLGQATFGPQAVALGQSAHDLRRFVVFIGRAAATNIMRHGEKGLQTESEVAGALVGRPAVDPATGRLVTQIVAALPAHGRADQYEVEIPPEEWLRLSSLVQEEEPYRGRAILVGWYHSHPTFDAYLSPLDQQTQRQFFSEPWHVAIVVGPQRRQIKAFHGRDSEPCALYLDPEEAGGRLVPVTYEVTAGAVSTPSGVEWVAPPEHSLPPGSDLESSVEPTATPAPATATPALPPGSDLQLSAEVIRQPTTMDTPVEPYNMTRILTWLWVFVAILALLVLLIAVLNFAPR